jgi:uncharacterized protein
MKIHFDFVHPSDVNLFKNAIQRLQTAGHQIFITIRERGNLSAIVKSELDSYEFISLGNHKRGFFNKLVALITREISLFHYLRDNHIQISVNQGFSCILSCKLLKIPFIIFEDDYEYKLAFYYGKLFSTRDIMPDFIPETGNNIYKYHGFKELAYLHPREFIPETKNLKIPGLLPFKYVFIREISNISLNYTNRESYLDEVVNLINSKNLQIVLSLENKSLSSQFESRCMILKEPINEIYSLIGNALFVISSGDTMAREASLLGIPTIYTGGRDMLMNKPLIENGIMYTANTFLEIKYLVDYFLVEDNAFNIRSKTTTTISNDWDDTTDIIIKHINDFIT